MRTRFAPSPTGYLHLGHAYAASQAFGAARDAAKDEDGTCLLRIEDIDHTRCQQKYTGAIFEDLHWLGFTWPDSRSEPVRRQSEHRAEYEKVIESLAERELIYRCFLTRAELKNQVQISPNEQKARIARGLAKGETYAWRLSISRAKDELGPRFAALSYSEDGVQTLANADSLGDAVIARKDIGLSYHLCVTHDDAAQGITDIVRGTDLRDSTGFHVLLQALMGWPTPRYRHHRLLLREDGQKLAKRNSDTAIRDLRAQGLSPQEVLAMAALIG